jgi:hypothetical protein
MTKKGRIGADEKSRIESYLATESDKDIAKRFDRTVLAVERIRAESKAVESNPAPSNNYVAVLHTRYFWNAVQRQLISSDEKRYFEQSWAALYEQFVGSDVAHTDEMMIKDLIMLDIQLNRALEDRSSLSTDIERLRGDLEKAYRIEDVGEKTEKVSNINRTISQCVAAMETATKMGNDLQGKKDKKFEQLKGTRDQRFKTEQQSKVNFFERIKYLDEKKQRDEQGRRNELIKLSALKFQEGFEVDHEFEDGEYDKVFLTPEAVERDRERHAEISEEETVRVGEESEAPSSPDETEAV